MDGKTTVCYLVLILLESSALGSFARGVAEGVSESQGANREDLARVMFLLAARHSPKCLWVVVDEEGLQQRPWSHTHLTLDPSTGEASATIDYINKNTERVTLFACITFLMTRPPEPSLYPVLTDTSNTQLTRYFIARFPSETAAEDYLLDERLAYEENVAALVEHGGPNITVDVLTRQLFHPSGSAQIRRVTSWVKGKGFTNGRDVFPQQMSNFYGTKLRGVTLDFRPFTDYEEVKDSRVVVPKPSLDVFILEVIADKLNFTYELVMPEDGLWGYMREDVSTEGRGG